MENINSRYNPKKKERDCLIDKESFFNKVILEFEKQLVHIQYLDDDDDYIPINVYVEYRDVSVWVDFLVKNDNLSIDGIDVKDHCDNDFIDLAEIIKYYLDTDYCLKKTKEHLDIFIQSVDIINDNNDQYSLGRDVRSRPKYKSYYVDRILSICEIDTPKDNITLFIETGLNFGKLTLKKTIKASQVVDIFLPIIDDDVFSKHIKSTDTSKRKSEFLHLNFGFKVKTFQNYMSSNSGL